MDGRRREVQIEGKRDVIGEGMIGIGKRMGINGCHWR